MLGPSRSLAGSPSAGIIGAALAAFCGALSTSSQGLSPTTTTEFVQELEGQNFSSEFAEGFDVDGRLMAFTQSTLAHVYGRSPGAPWALTTTLSTSFFIGELDLTGDALALGDRSNDRVEIRRQDEGGPDNWGVTHVLSSPVPGSSSRFGHRIERDGDTLVIAAPGDGELSTFDTEGRVYVFERNMGGPDAWGLAQTLVPPSNLYREFGKTLALNGDLLAVGAFEASTDIEGVVSIFTRDSGSWSLEATLQGTPGFGLGLDLHEDRVAIGTPFQLNDPSDGGRVDLYGRNLGGGGAWGKIQTLVPTDLGPGDQFGTAVSLQSGVLVASAPQLTPDKERYRSYGNVWVFRERPSGNWGEEARILPPDPPQAAGLFGGRVLLQGRNLYIADSYEDSLFVYRRGPSTIQAKRESEEVPQ